MAILTIFSSHIKFQKLEHPDFLWFLNLKIETNPDKGAIIFYVIGGGHEKAGGVIEFFHEQ